MRYLCLIYYEASMDDALPAREADLLVGEACAYREELRLSGHHLASGALQPSRAVTTVRVRGGSVSVTGGPVAGSVVQPSGFVLVEARDLNEAIRLVSRMPQARAGSVEVRPVEEMCPGP